MNVSLRTQDPTRRPTLSELADTRCLVLGAARSGLAAVRLLRRVGAHVTLYDRDTDRLAAAPEHVQTLSGATLPSFDTFDWIIQSPGIPVPPSQHMVPEVDLAALGIQAQQVGVTGTNGKSTTTSLIAAMLEQSGIPTAIGGNIGVPLCDLCERAADWCAVELSSFQLEHARWLTPRVGVLLNLDADHLDRHGSLEAYGAAKERLAQLLEPHGTLVFNLDDPWAASVAARVHPRGALGFSTRLRPSRGAYLDASTRELVLAPRGTETLRVRSRDLAASVAAHPGNVLAAMLAAWAAGASPHGITTAATTFAGLPHRMQRVAERNGVRYINDSKATNPAAARASLENVREPVVWLAGGSNKGVAFSPLASATGGVRMAILYGQSAQEIASVLRGQTEVEVVPTLREAVTRAAQLARPGDVVLLSPACASFDQFDNFEHRGECFTRWVEELPCSS